MSQDHYTGLLNQIGHLKAVLANKPNVVHFTSFDVEVKVREVSTFKLSVAGGFFPTSVHKRDTFNYHVAHVDRRGLIEMLDTLSSRDRNRYRQYGRRLFARMPGQSGFPNFHVESDLMLEDDAHTTLCALNTLWSECVFEAWVRRMIYLTPFTVSDTVLACVLHEKGEESRTELGSTLTKMWHHEQGLVRHVLSFLFPPDVDWNYVRYYDVCYDEELGEDKVLYAPVPPSKAVELPKCKLTGSKRYHGAYASSDMDCSDVAPLEAEILLSAVDVSCMPTLNERTHITSLHFCSHMLTCQHTPGRGSVHTPNYTFTWGQQVPLTDDEVSHYVGGNY